jgi:two-component sensor histidine kinase
MTSSPSDSPHRSDILRVLRSAAVTTFAQDRNLKYLWIENPPTSWHADSIAGSDDSALLPGPAAAAAAALKRDVLSSGRAQWGDIIVDRDGSPTYFDLFVQPETDPEGVVTGLLGLAIDVTDRRKQAATLEAVGRDLAHRSKNLLAIIQSLATHTARSTPNTDAFVEQFRGRIQSISRSQDLSIGSKRRGAMLSELVASQVAPYVVDSSAQIGFSGLDCHLSPNAALHVGLALYELCIASVQAGALSADKGRAEIHAERADSPAEGQSSPLRLTWTEKDGPFAPEIEGFALILLQRVVPSSVGGIAQLGGNPSGRRYELTIAGNEFWDA